MPLPFLTADPVFDEMTDNGALPFDDGDSWRRPYRLGPWRVAAAALCLLLASFILIAAMLIGLTGELSSAGGCSVLSAVLIVVALRSLRVGAWVSHRGIRRVTMFTTVTVAWNEVTMVRTVQQPVRWLGLPRTVQGQAVVVDRERGAQLALFTDHNADFLPPAAGFSRAADVIEAWGDENRRG